MSILHYLLSSFVRDSLFDVNFLNRTEWLLETDLLIAYGSTFFINFPSSSLPLMQLQVSLCLRTTTACQEFTFLPNLWSLVNLPVSSISCGDCIMIIIQLPSFNYVGHDNSPSVRKLSEVYYHYKVSYMQLHWSLKLHRSYAFNYCVSSLIINALSIYTNLTLNILLACLCFTTSSCGICLPFLTQYYSLTQHPLSSPSPLPVHSASK